MQCAPWICTRCAPNSQGTARWIAAARGIWEGARARTDPPLGAARRRVIPALPPRAIRSARFYLHECAKRIARGGEMVPSDRFRALRRVETHGSYRSRLSGELAKCPLGVCRSRSSPSSTVSPPIWTRKPPSPTPHRRQAHLRRPPARGPHVPHLRGGHGHVQGLGVVPSPRRKSPGHPHLSRILPVAIPVKTRMETT